MSPRRSGRASVKPDVYTSTTYTTTTRPRGKTVTKTTKTTGGVTKAAPRKRKTSIKDKVEGVLLKTEGTLLRKPGKKAAGTKKIRGTDGKLKTKKV